LLVVPAFFPSWQPLPVQKSDTTVSTAPAVRSNTAFQVTTELGSTPPGGFLQVGIPRATVGPRIALLQVKSASFGVDFRLYKRLPPGSL
jgi:hypothetical protein